MLIKVLIILLILLIILISIAFLSRRKINKDKSNENINYLNQMKVINNVDDDKTNELLWEENTIELNSKDITEINYQIDDFIIEEEIKVIHSRNII